LGNNRCVEQVFVREQQYRCVQKQIEVSIMKKLSSAALATAAAVLFTSGFANVAMAGDDAKMHCAGVNSCKGTSECKSAKNSCKGMNSCKGQGWVSMSKAECKDAKAKAKSS
jgi:hypothetical protein